MAVSLSRVGRWKMQLWVALRSTRAQPSELAVKSRIIPMKNPKSVEKGVEKV